MASILSNTLDQALSYEAYLSLSEELFAQGKTTGPNQSDMLTHYTGLNLKRMHRLDKTIKLGEDAKTALAGIQEPQTWVLITEAWCGDASQIVPIIHHIAAASEQVSLQILLRDEHLEIMDAYLTNGARAIPKLVILRTADLQELGTWGPRPAQAQARVEAYKALVEKPPHEELTKELHIWYTRDKSLSIQAEIAELLTNIQTKELA
jgi:hypothetical protein